MKTSENKKSAAIIYLSPHGTTRKAMETLSESLIECDINADMFNLSEYLKNDEIQKLYDIMPDYPLLVFGSPTYFHHAPPVFTDFLQKIPGAGDDQAAIVLSTYGGVSSGVIQSDVTKILHKKNYCLLGGIKVVTEHCMTFKEDPPHFAGHPNKTDLKKIKDFGKEISVRLMHQDRKHYAPSDFNDKPSLLNFIDDKFNKMENFTWAMPNVKVKQDLCTGCGVCVRHCPVSNITLEKFPLHHKNCTYCYSCVRHCPNEATITYMKPFGPVVRWLSKRFSRYEEHITEQII